MTRASTESYRGLSCVSRIYILEPQRPMWGHKCEGLIQYVWCFYKRRKRCLGGGGPSGSPWRPKSWWQKYAHPCKLWLGEDILLRFPAPRPGPECTLKGQVRDGSCRVCDQLMHSFLIDWQWGHRAVSQGLTLSILRLQEVWELYANDHQVVNDFVWVGILASVKQLRKSTSKSVS